MNHLEHIELEEGWVIEKDMRYGAMYFLGHYCPKRDNEIGFAIRRFNDIVNCGSCEVEAPDCAVGYLNFIRDLMI